MTTKTTTSTKTTCPKTFRVPQLTPSSHRFTPCASCRHRAIVMMRSTEVNDGESEDRRHVAAAGSVGGGNGRPGRSEIYQPDVAADVPDLGLSGALLPVDRHRRGDCGRGTADSTRCRAVRDRSHDRHDRSVLHPDHSREEWRR